MPRSTFEAATVGVATAMPHRRMIGVDHEIVPGRELAPKPIRMADATSDRLRWLVELREHLVPAIELLDARGGAVLPAARGDLSARLRRLTHGGLEPEIERVLRDARASGSVAFTHVDSLRVAGIALKDSAGTPLTLLLAERADTGREAARRAELTRLASWLVRIVGRGPMAVPVDAARDWHEISVLHRMLTKAVATGSVTAVMHAFVEALAVWADIDTRAYMGDRSGRFTLEVALAGADPASAPRMIPADAIVEFVAPTQLDAAQAERLGFPAGASVVVAPLHDDHAAAWLLTYLGASNRLEQDRLALFHDLLVPALHSAGEVEASRLMWSMMQQLIAERASPRDAAADAVSELEQAGLCTAAMLVLRRGSEIVLQLGTPVPRGPLGEAWPAAALQHFALAVPEPFQASLTLWRPADRPFTGRDTRLGAIGASVLASWTASALRRGDLAAEAPATRASERRRHAASPSSEVSLLVIRPESESSTPDVRELWVGEIRRRLRPADVAGALASGEIGILLPETGADDAHAVAARLRKTFGQYEPFALLAGAPIGIATGRRAASDGYSILRQARADAEEGADASTGASD